MNPIIAYMVSGFLTGLLVLLVAVTVFVVVLCHFLRMYVVSEANED